MANIAWYGAGLMSAGFIEALRKRGDDVVVYNRTFEKAKALERFGARAEADPRAAARGADRIHIMIGDDASVDGLLEKLDGAIDAKTVVIDHSTVAPVPTAARFERMAAAGTEFLHAPVFMSPQGARDAGGVMLVSGPQATFDRVRADLAKMTADLWYVGERPDKSAALKLFGNGLLFFIVAGLADTYALAKSAGLEPAEAFELYSHFKPGGNVDFRGKNMAASDFTPHFELAMARKDARLIMETVEAAHEKLHVLPTIVARMDELIAQGHGGEDLAVLGIDAVAKTPEAANR